MSVRLERPDEAVDSKEHKVKVEGQAKAKKAFMDSSEEKITLTIKNSIQTADDLAIDDELA